MRTLAYIGKGGAVGPLASAIRAVRSDRPLDQVTTTLTDEDFNALTPPAVPAGTTSIGSSLVTVGAVGVGGTVALQQTTTSGTVVQSVNYAGDSVSPGGPAGNVRVSFTARCIVTTGAQGGVAGARIRWDFPQTTGASNTYYSVELYRGFGVAGGIAIKRRLYGIAETTLAVLTFTLDPAEFYRVQYSALDSAHTVILQRISDSQYLSAAGAWQAGSTNCLSVTNSGIPTSGYYGPATFLNQAAGAVIIDDLLVESLADVTPRSQPYTAVEPGQRWYDENDVQLQAHGGGVTYDATTNRYYLIGMDMGAPTSAQNVQTLGVRCYSSTDLINWQDEGLIITRPVDSDVVERPKMLRCPATGKWVVWAHLDNLAYTQAKVGVWYADAPTGPFTFSSSFLPDGMASRDMTLFQDDDGTGYLYFSSSANGGLRVAQLASNYLTLAGASTSLGVGNRESPAVFRRNSTYYMISSASSGWTPNQNNVHTATAPTGTWSAGTNVFASSVSESNTVAYRTQATHVIKSQSGEYIYMGDRWLRTNLGDSTYGWWPVAFDGSGNATISYVSSFTPTPLT